MHLGALPSLRRPPHRVLPGRQGGAIKLYKGLECPLDGFELVLFSLAGADGKTSPLCPFCFNHPPFEDAGQVRAPGSGGDLAPSAARTPAFQERQDVTSGSWLRPSMSASAASSRWDAGAAVWLLPTYLLRWAS